VCGFGRHTHWNLSERSAGRVRQPDAKKQLTIGDKTIAAGRDRVVRVR
jgi:hypothetical protein